MPSPKDPEKRKMWIENIIKSRIGKHFSEETRIKFKTRPQCINPPMRGKTHSKETLDKLSELNKGENNPNYGKRWSLEMRKKFSDSHTGLQAGERSPRWKGGISFEPYCILFNDEFKERVRAFFGHTCVECGKTQFGNKKKLHIHHVNYKKDACCNKKVHPRFVPLCNNCHPMTNTKRQFWEDWFNEIIEEFYSGKCYYTKEEMENRNSKNYIKE
jgi:hypothetical protein